VNQDALFRTLIEGTTTALVLVAETGTIVFANQAARELFFEGRDATGANFLQLVANASEPLRRALASDGDQIFTFDDNGQSEIYHLGTRHLPVDGRAHTLISVRHMTQEVSRQEIAVLKKTLRIIGHELGNSMAPASSLLHSARQMLERPELHAKLGAALATVEERLQHLSAFLSGLMQLGQVPRPKKRDVSWPEFLGGLRALWPAVTIGAPPATPGWFDPAQIQQVIINLVKNATEAGGDPAGVAIELETPPEGGVRVSVLDRGPGMSDDVMGKALTPAFTTKETGSGLGLPLCRDIVEGHDGRLRIGRRPGGGMAISFWLPARVMMNTPSVARLTLTGHR